MTEEIKDVNAKIDAAEEAMKKYASKDTVISIGGYEFTPAKLMVAFTLVSSTLGGLYGAFAIILPHLNRHSFLVHLLIFDSQCSRPQT